MTTFGPDDRYACLRYLELAARMARLQAAEDRAFEAYMNGGSAGSARSAKSRVNRLSPELASAEGAVYRIMDRVEAETDDLAKMARQVIEATEPRPHGWHVAVTDLLGKTVTHPAEPRALAVSRADRTITFGHVATVAVTRCTDDCDSCPKVGAAVRCDQ